ncbi:MAG: ABC transporter substrate-binding protein [Candidimonas sp.]|nr:MAG: ABC transporter substrate-binding protein [Candidimonas sp.]TAM19141.1 MAG: ABC transporter substrate-binding protein [Candidimonas sp.]TAM76559.1 MAG: ABC transporter substrate-binding protein [Candidimonas sp.]
MNNNIQDRRRFIAMLGILSLSTALPKDVFAKSGAAPLTFGAQNTSWGAVAMVAEAEKTFKKAGANVTAFQFDSGKAVRDAMIAGRIDIGVLGTTPMIIGVAKGNMQPLAMAMYAGKTDAIVVRKGSGIKSIADLKGKKVASQLGSSTDHVFQDKIMPKFGLVKGDVQIVNVKFTDQVAALIAGSVDAFAGVEPYPSVAEIDGIGVVLLDYSKFDILPVWVAINRPVLEKNPQQVTAFLRGWLAAVQIFKDTPDEVTNIILKHFTDQGYHISKSTIQLMLSKLDVNPNYVPGLKKYLYEQSKVMQQQKQIHTIPDWDKILDPKYLQLAKKTQS